MDTSPGIRPLPDEVAGRLERLDREFAGEGLHTGAGAGATTHLLHATGKRIRPTMVLLCAAAVADRIPETVCAAAKAVELLHTATLHHDDVMDQGTSRRGAPSVNARWGNRIAVLSGDFLLARATAILAGLGDEVNQRVSVAVNDVIEGQLRETQDLGNLDLSVERYYDVIIRKTAALFELSCWLGAQLGGASGPQAQSLAEFGRQFGIAYQITDDVLDLLAGSATLGKAPLADLRLGVLTLPLLFGLRRHPDADAGTIVARWLAAAETSRADDVIRNDLRRTNALVDAYQASVAACDLAADALDALPSSEARESLGQMPHRLLQRCGPYVYGELAESVQ